MPNSPLATSCSLLQQLVKIILLSALVLSVTLARRASAQINAQERAASLRSQLGELEKKQTALQTRLNELEENLKPENIAQELAGVGSTHPEELREQRRRQLESQRTSVLAQIDQLAGSHSRLETAIAEADAQAYQQSAGAISGAPQQTNDPPASVNPVQPPVQRTNTNKKRRLKLRRRPARHPAH